MKTILLIATICLLIGCEDERYNRAVAHTEYVISSLKSMRVGDTLKTDIDLKLIEDDGTIQKWISLQYFDGSDYVKYFITTKRGKVVSIWTEVK